VNTYSDISFFYYLSCSYHSQQIDFCLLYSWRTSLLGTPTEPEKRKALKCLCFFKLVPGSLLRIVTMILGLVSIIILEDFCECQHLENAQHNDDENSDNRNLAEDLLRRGEGGQCSGKFYRVRLLLIILIISHMTDVCLATFIHMFVLFTSDTFRLFQLVRWMMQTLCCCIKRGQAPNTSNGMDGSGWRCFCSCCFALTSLLTCCLLGGRQAATADFRDISMALVTFLDDGGHLDVTISDVLCALVVLHKQHQEQRYAHIHRIQSQILTVVEMSSREHQEHHQQPARITSNSNNSIDADSPYAPAAADSVEPTGARTLGAGRFDDHGDDQHAVDLEVVMLTDSYNSEATGHGGSHTNTKPVDYDEDDVEHGQPDRVQRQERAPTMSRWTLQRGNTENKNNNNFDDNSMYYQRQERDLLNPTDASAKFAIAASAHFLRFALAIYGPSLLPVARPCQGSLCVLGLDACCTASSSRRQQPHRLRQTSNNSNISYTDPCYCNENTLLREANLTMDDVAYAAFHSSVDINPYCIIIDRPWKSIVVAIRGSLSLESIVTDLDLVPVPLVTGLAAETKDQQELQECINDINDHRVTDDEATNSSRIVYCHSGMLQTAQWMYKDLQRHGILDKLLLEENDAPHADYQLVLTGHSLGAGLAAILAIMLRPKFPTLRCFCFAPPGCTLSENALEASKDDDFITSYVVGSDIFPRMSLEAMESLRDDVLETIARIKVNKGQAMGGGGGGGYCCGPSSTLGVAELLHHEESMPHTKFQAQLLAFWAHQATVRETNPIGIVKLHPPPGKMVHFVKTRTKSSRRIADTMRVSADATSMSVHSSSYAALWAERQDFSEIQLSASMLSNHYPWTALAIMEQIATEQFGLNAPYFVP
jgi:Lipase (class 3)